MYGAGTLFGWPFQDHSTNFKFSYLTQILTGTGHIKDDSTDQVVFNGRL
jgi:hypothetical protein